MEKTGTYQGGLVFHSTQDDLLERFSKVVSATLEDYGHRVERQVVLDDENASVTSTNYLVRLSLHPVIPDASIDEPENADAEVPTRHERPAPRVSSQGPQRRMVIRLEAADPIFEDPEQSHLLLVVIMYRLVDICPTDSVEWLDEDTILPIEDFLGAFANIAPKRPPRRRAPVKKGEPRFEPVEETEPGLTAQYDTLTEEDSRRSKARHGYRDALASVFRSDEKAPNTGSDPQDDPFRFEKDSDIRRLAAWSMTGTVAFVSTPVAVSLAAVNLIRGEDFRLNTHVMTLTVCLFMLNTSGALADVVNSLPL